MSKTNRSISSALAFLTLIASANLQAQQLELTCLECRHPTVHPSDFGNYALNEARRPNNGYTYDQLDLIKVINGLGEWAMVDLDFANLTIPVINIPVPIPSGDINITVTDANGNVTLYTIRGDIGGPLAVGTGYGPGYNERLDRLINRSNSDISELGESASQRLDMVEPGIYNDDSLVDIGGGIGIRGTDNFCGPGTDYVCVY